MQTSTAHPKIILTTLVAALSPLAILAIANRAARAGIGSGSSSSVRETGAERTVAQAADGKGARAADEKAAPKAEGGKAEAGKSEPDKGDAAKTEPAKPATPAEADTPERAVKRLGEAVAAVKAAPPGGEAADKAMDALYDVFDDRFGPSMKSLMRFSRRIGESHDRLVKALDAKFGADPSAKLRLPPFWLYERNFREGLADVEKVEMTDRAAQGEGKALVTVRFTGKAREAKDGKPATPPVREDRFLTSVQGGKWKLLPEKLDDERTLKLLAMQIEAFAKTPDILDRTAKEVAAGRYKTREEADQAAFSSFLSVVEGLQQKAATGQ
jgi:hypothetical protein